MASELTGRLLRTTGARGRAPGFITLDHGAESSTDLTTFDRPTLHAAAAFVGKEVVATYERKPSKDGSKTYLNLLAVRALHEEDSEPPQNSSLAGLEEGKLELESTISLPVVSTQRVEGKLVPRAPLEPVNPIIQLERNFALAKRRRELLEGFIREQFQEGVHYMEGKTFGSSKRVLLLDGARLIHVCHGHTIRYEILSGPLAAQKPNTPYTIVIKAQVYLGETLIGEGLGSCTSMIYSNRSGTFQDRAANPDLTHNSTLKMAKKRAYVDSCLNSTALTEFSQDLDEAPPVEAD